MKRQNRQHGALSAAALFAVFFSIILCTVQIFASMPGSESWYEEAAADVWFESAETTEVPAADADFEISEAPAADADFESYEFSAADAVLEPSEISGDDTDLNPAETSVDDDAAIEPSEAPLAGDAGPETMTVTVELNWEDEDDADGLREYSGGNVYVAGYINTNVQIWKTEQPYDSLAPGGNETVTFYDVPVYWDGQKVEYWAGLSTVPEHYERKIYGDADEGFLIRIIHEPETVSASCTVRWEDGQNRDGIRGDVVLRLIRSAGGASETAETTTVGAPSGSDEAEFSWNAIPKYWKGQEAAYSIEAETADGYEVEVSSEGGNEFAVTCTHEHAASPITVKIWWQDDDNADGLRPDSVSVRLLADDGETGDAIAVSSGSGWAGEFEEPEGDADYAVLVEVPGGYLSVVKGNSEDGFAIVNIR